MSAIIAGTSTIARKNKPLLLTRCVNAMKLMIGGVHDDNIEHSDFDAANAAQSYYTVYVMYKPDLYANSRVEVHFVRR